MRVRRAVPGSPPRPRRSDTHGLPELLGTGGRRHPTPQTRSTVTARITAHVTQGWPHLGEPVVTYRGRFCYVAARLPGQPQPRPILRLRYQGSADRWAIGIYLASDQRYTEAELPTSFGPKTGTPEQGIDHTFILYAGPGRQR